MARENVNIWAVLNSPNVNIMARENVNIWAVLDRKMLTLWPGKMLTFGLFYIKQFKIKNIRKQRTKPDTTNIKKKPNVSFSCFLIFLTFLTAQG